VVVVEVDQHVADLGRQKAGVQTASAMSRKATLDGRSGIRVHGGSAG
jgi:hypothetical protein